MSHCRICDVICNNRIYRDVESVLQCNQWVMYIIMVLTFFGVCAGQFLFLLYI